MRVVDYAKGLPLALKTLGSFLYGKSKQEWSSALNKLGRIANNDIQKVLLISYDGLDDEQKDIFLDIACFFNGERRDYVTRILFSCGFAADVGIRVLIDKSLITISDDKLGMHDLLEDMGLEIIRQQSIKEPGERSRLCIPEDVYHVLTKNTGTKNVEGIFVDLFEIKKMKLNSQAFTRMYNLRMLKFSGSVHLYESPVQIPQGVDYLSDRLSYLHWDNYPLKYLPSNFNLENLVELVVRGSRLVRLWNGVPNLVKLKHIDLTGCQHLSGILELSRATNLESIHLRSCTSLLEIPSFIGCFHKLITLNLCHCTKLKRLPGSICNLDSLHLLNLFGCSNLKKLPNIPRGIKYLYLKETGIEEVPFSSIKYLSKLEELDLEHCRRLKNLPSNLCNLNSLETLTLSRCSNITRFPQVSGNITRLCLSGTAIEDFPSSSIKYLSNLEELDLRNCQRLKNLPSSLSNLNSLMTLTLSGCSNITKFPQVPGNITRLWLSGTAIEEVPSSSIEYLYNLEDLNLGYCQRLMNLPSSVSNLNSLVTLTLSGCSNITRFPQVSGNITNLWLNGTAIEEVPSSSIENLSNLRFLRLHNCQSLEKFPDISSSVRHLPLFGTRTEEVPSSVERNLHRLYLGQCRRPKSNLSSLCILDLYGCPNITTFPKVPRSLSHLNLGRTAIQEVPSSIECLSNLRILNLRDCRRLENLPSNICNWSSLFELDLYGCPNITTFPNVPRCISYLNLGGTAIQEVPSSIEHLCKLRALKLRNCQRLDNLPRNICNLIYLCRLDLYGCPNITTFPKVPRSIYHLNLSGTAIQEMPSSIGCLSKLRVLRLRNCTRLENLPHSISKLKCTVIDLSNSSKLDKQGILEIFKCSILNREFSILLPGSEMPLWFKHQSMGSSTSIQVHPHRCRINLKGLATCGVFGVHWQSTPFQYYPKVWCRITLGRRVDFFNFSSIGFKSNHLFFRFLRWEDVRRSCEEELVSDIKIEFGSSIPGLKVKKCGLRLVYKEDYEEILHGLDKSPVEESAIINQSHENYNCYDEVEPTEWECQRRLKRLCLSTGRALIILLDKILLKYFLILLVGLLLSVLYSSWLS